MNFTEKRKLLVLFLCFLFTFSIMAQNDQERTITRDLVKPPILKKGDTIIILSPAGKLKDRTVVDPGIELANHWGLVVFF
jgi:muramoyltetrapeptide carboxypeptidase